MVILAAMLNTDSSVSSRSHFIRCSWTVVYREGILSYVEGILMRYVDGYTEKYTELHEWIYRVTWRVYCMNGWIY